MIDYATYQRIQHLHRVEQLTVTQIAHAMALDARTVRRWLDEPRFRPRALCTPQQARPLQGLHPPASRAPSLQRRAGPHGETHQRPLDLFALERDQLRPLPELLYDIGAVHTVRASNRFRVTFDTNRYSVPAEYASQRLTLKSYPERLCIYHHDRLLARHPRSYERHRDFEHPDHPRALLKQRRTLEGNSFRMKDVIDK